MKIQFNTGNFALEITGEFSADAQAKALEAALKYIVQRDIASKVYIAIAGVPGKKAEKVLPEGFERESVKFDTVNAKAFKVEAEKALARLGTFSVNVSQHVAGESVNASQEAENAWTGVQQMKGEDFTAAMKLLGIDPKSDYTDEQGIAACMARIRAKKAADKANPLALAKAKLGL